jgi:hypothetical protein
MRFSGWISDVLKRHFGRTGTANGYSPVDLEQHILTAYKLLSDATQSAIKIPQEVVDVIVKAREAALARAPDARHGSFLNSELEVQFWSAYGLLNSSIRPAEKARKRYRRIFYVVLAVLLAGQFFFLVGDHVRLKLAELDKQIVDIRGRAAAPNLASTGVDAAKAAELQIQQTEKAQYAYLQLSRRLLEIAGNCVNYPLALVGLPAPFSTEDSADVIVRGKLDIVLVFLSGYLLPMMYGLLGACAFVLRQLSAQGDRPTYAYNAQVQYSLRLNIGLLSGLAVSWFIKPGSGDSTLVSLSPLALAFVAGYGSDLFFVALDKVVQAFTPASTAPGRTEAEPASEVGPNKRQVPRGGATKAGSAAAKPRKLHEATSTQPKAA